MNERMKQFIVDYKQSFEVEENQSTMMIRRKYFIDFIVIFFMASILFFGIGYLFNVNKNLSYVIFSLITITLGSFVISTWAYEVKQRVFKKTEYSILPVMLISSLRCLGSVTGVFLIMTFAYYGLVITTLDVVILLILYVIVIVSLMFFMNMFRDFGDNFGWLWNIVFGTLLMMVFQFVLPITDISLNTAISFLFVMVLYLFTIVFKSSTEETSSKMFTYGLMIFVMAFLITGIKYINSATASRLISEVIKVEETFKMSNNDVKHIEKITENYVFMYNHHRSQYEVYDKELNLLSIQSFQGVEAVYTFGDEFHVLTETEIEYDNEGYYARGEYKIEVFNMDGEMIGEEVLFNRTSPRFTLFYIEDEYIQFTNSNIFLDTNGDTINEFDGNVLSELSAGEIFYQDDDLILYNSLYGLRYLESRFFEGEYVLIGSDIKSLSDYLEGKDDVLIQTNAGGSIIHFDEDNLYQLSGGNSSSLNVIDTKDITSELTEFDYNYFTQWNLYRNSFEGSLYLFLNEDYSTLHRIDIVDMTEYKIVGEEVIMTEFLMLVEVSLLLLLPIAKPVRERGYVKWNY